MEHKAFLQEQLRPEDWKIVQQMGINLDSRVLAEMWPDFVNFEQRWETEIPFLLQRLKGVRNPKILDAAVGAGVTSIGLKRVGIEDVIGNEIDEDFRAVAVQQAEKYGVELTFTQHDWRALPAEWFGTFDAVLCLGNSLTYLFKPEDTKASILNFRRVLKPGGQLIIDERNYDVILSGRYKHSGEVVYCGTDKVDTLPTYVSPTMVVMEYSHKISGKTAHLVMYPFKGPAWPELPRGAFSEVEEGQLRRTLNGINAYVAEEGSWLPVLNPEALGRKSVAKAFENGQTLTVTCTALSGKVLEMETKLEISGDNLGTASCRLLEVSTALHVIEVGGSFYRYALQANQPYLKNALPVVKFLAQMYGHLQR